MSPNTRPYSTPTDALWITLTTELILEAELRIGRLKGIIEMALGLLPCLAAYAIKLYQKTKQETATKITSATATCVSNVRGTMR